MATLRALVVSLIVLAAAVARAGSVDELAEARRLRQVLDFEGALAAVERAIAAGDADPARLVEAYRLGGELAAGLGREADAVAWFERALALEPAIALPAGTSPKITAPFERARAAIAARGGPLAIEVEETADGVAVVVVRDPLGMVAGAARVAIAAAPGERWEAVVRDAHGNVLWRRAGTRAALVAPPPPERPARVGRPAWWARGEVWSIAAIGFAGAGGVAAWQLGEAQDEWDRLRAAPEPEFGELRAIERRGRRYATMANVSFAMAAVTTTVATILFVREAGRDVDDSLTVVGGVSDGAATLGIAGAF